MAHSDDEAWSASPDRRRGDGARADAIDRLQRQWIRERPDIDVSSVGITSRVWRTARMLTRIRDAQLRRLGTDAVTVDVLAELRRAGPPYRMTAGQLREVSSISAGGVSQRLDRLERADLIERSISGGDRRVINVRLTEKGRALIDSVLAELMANESAMLEDLSPSEHRRLEDLLRRVMEIVEKAEHRTK
ncbi:MAG: MarR family winged helix-turn-helix transcriptional regulator [Rubrobacteraceae bacterium]